jgi:hypothetical protein
VKVEGADEFWLVVLESEDEEDVNEEETDEEVEENWELEADESDDDKLEVATEDVEDVVDDSDVLIDVVEVDFGERAKAA